MLLDGKNAIVYGAGGAVGGAVARAFAREGAAVFLAGRTAAPLAAVAQRIEEGGGTAVTAQVNALDETAVVRHVDAAAEAAGSVDVSFNAIAVDHEQVPLTGLSVKAALGPVADRVATHLLTARAARAAGARDAAGPCADAGRGRQRRRAHSLGPGHPADRGRDQRGLWRDR
jgi:NAD(P)-dependent dehydrogenase (short-subunit alcohol dehydrogenase family)